VEELEWYFLTLDEQEKQSTADYSGPAMILMKKKRKEIQNELDELKRKYRRNASTLEDLARRVVEALGKVVNSNKDVVAYQVRALMGGMEEAGFPMKTRMKIAVALVEGLVDPEIMREMGLLTEVMIEDSLHFLDTPEAMVLLAQRDVDEARANAEILHTKSMLTFRDALLNRLAKNRARRMNAPKAEVRQGILDEIYSKYDG